MSLSCPVSHSSCVEQRAFRQWKLFAEHEHVEEMKSKFESAQHGLENENLRLRGMIADERKKRATALIIRWKMHSLEPAFKAWRLHTAQRKLHKVDVMNRMLHRLDQADVWVSRNLDLNLDPDLNLEISILTLISCVVIVVQRAWRQWKLWTEHEKVMELKNSLSGQSGEISRLKAQLLEEKRKRAVALVQRWIMHSLEPTFKAWKSYTAERKQHKRDIMSKMLARLEMSGAWVRCLFTHIVSIRC